MSTKQERDRCVWALHDRIRDHEGAKRGLIYFCRATALWAFAFGAAGGLLLGYVLGTMV